MATLEEVLSNMSDEDYLHDIQFVIDEDLRTVAIPSKGVVAGVVGDKDINRINFVMPRYYNGFDMSEFEASIHYSNANNENNYYTVDDLTIERNCILFSWLVDSDVTSHAGRVKFVVKMVKKTGLQVIRSFSTTPAFATVLEGFNVEDRSVISDTTNMLSFGIGENPSCDSDIPRIYLMGNAAAMTKEHPVDMAIHYRSKNMNFDGVTNIKWQGNSSLNYPKKNFSIKLFTDATKSKNLMVNFKGWGKFNKFVLKANYIDFSHARNIVSSRIWGKIVSERANYESLPVELRTTPNNGSIDGFLVRVYVNGVYQGRYTLNYGKDAIMWNMDSGNPNHAALCGENYESGCFLAEADIDESDWSLEFPKTLTNSIKNSFNNAISFVMESTDEEFVNSISEYFDLESLIDYYIFAYVSCGLDSMGKNQIYLTYDGTHWIASMYDMDSTWGLYWDGSEFVSSEYRCQEDYESGYHKPNDTNKLYARLASLFEDQIKERYEVLRAGSLSATNIIEEFEKFMTPCSESLMNKDLDAYSDIPSNDADHDEQIRQFVVDRLKYVDRIMRYNIKTVLREDFSPNDETWVDECDVDFESGEYLEFKVDSLGDGTTENLLSIGCGTNISTWYNDGSTIHLYTTVTDDGNELRIDLTNEEENQAQNIEMVALPLTIKLDKDGLYINDSLYTPSNDVDQYNYILSDMLQHTSIVVGSEEGTDRSASHYKYITVGR